MQAVVYQGPREFTVTTVGERDLQIGEVRVRVLASGVCGTDRHVHEGGFGAKFPNTPGHEIVGEIAEVGRGVAELARGDRVVVDNLISCGRCPQCRIGRSGLCARLQGLGVTHPGGAAEFVVVDADKCVPIDDIPIETAVLAEPVACAIHGLDVLQPRVGGDILIIGAGPSGQVLAQLLSRHGASRVIVAGPTPFKLDVAARNGADGTVQTERDNFMASIPALRDIAPEGFDIIVDATGAQPVLPHCMPLVRNGGTLMLYGMAPEFARIEISPYEVFRRELTVKGAFSQSNCIPRAVRLLRSGKVRCDGIVTHRFGLDEYGEALTALGGSRCLKAVVIPT